MKIQNKILVVIDVLLPQTRCLTTNGRTNKPETTISLFHN